jgi:uncharacterized protein involved in exopolysaccharide biosynthesis/Mrp family chromosome partitioning ATPase
MHGSFRSPRGSSVRRAWQSSPDPQHTAERNEIATEQASEFVSLADIGRFVRTYFPSIIVSVAAGLLLSTFYLMTTPKTFVGHTQILIDPKLPQVLAQQASEVNLSLDTAQVESQIAVLQSEKIASMVIEKLKLGDNPDFNRSRSPTLGVRLKTFIAATTEMLGLRDNRYLRSWLDRTVGPAVSTASASDERLQEMSQAEEAKQALSNFERSRRTMEIFRGNLEVRRVGVSYAIDLSFGSQNPVMAADVANAVADAFVREQIESKARAVREGGAWLEYRLKELRKQMNEATQAAQEFRAKHDYGFGRVAGSAQDSGSEQGPEARESEDPPTLEELEVTADTYRKIYESFLQAFTSSVSQQSYPVADARIITPATAPLGPSSPKSKLVQIFGLLAGAMVGVGFAFVRNMLDRTIRWPQQVRQQLGLELLGELPVKMERRGRSVGNELERLTGSRFSENLRRVKTAISLIEGNRPIRTLGFASSTPYEGRSSSVCALATLYAMSGLRTLVIETDPSRFSATRSTWRAAGPALVQGEVKPITARIVRSGSGWFDIFPNSAVEANDLLIPGRMRLLLDQLQSYDMIVVDLPSLTSGGEGLAISSLLDATVLVVKWGQTPVDLVVELLRALRASRATTIGVLMTGVRIMSTRRYPSKHRSRERMFRRTWSVWPILKIFRTIFAAMKFNRAS